MARLGSLGRRQQKHKRAQAFGLLLGLGVCGAVTLHLSGGWATGAAERGQLWRRLADEEDDDLCSSKWDDWGGGEAFAFLLVTLYLFLGLGMICDDFFVPSLEIISDKLDLTPDVAGATFLAAGSSAPELFTSVADTFGPSDSSGYGVGTIVGSAMFNILIIVALSAASTTEILNIDWRPVTRDCGFYLTSIVMLAIIYNDGRVHWWEGCILWFTYGVYITFMAFNNRILGLCPIRAPGSGNETDEIESQDGSTRNQLVVTAHAETAIELPSKDLGSSSSADGLDKGGGDSEGGGDEDEGDPDNYFERFEFPADDSTLDKIYWIACLPFAVAFSCTVPDCSKTKAQHLYVVSFVMSIGWIMALCVGMVSTCTYVGCILNVRPVVMGVCVLAVGTSVPDAIGSMIVAKNGEADMAIANAVGSNVFDILLGLGVPWTIKGLVEGHATGVETCGVEVAVAILFTTVGVFFLVMAMNRWKMSPRVGWTFLALYVVYYVYQLVSAFDVLPSSISVVCS